MPAIAFDRFYRYAELTALLKRLRRRAPAARRDRIDRQEPRGPRHLGADRHQRRHRSRRGKARVLGRRQHPRDRGRGLGREPVFPAHAGHAVRQGSPTSRARSTPARSTSARASIPDGAEWALADKPKLVRSQHAALSVRRGRDRGPDGRGHRRRRPHPADAHPRSERPVEGPPARAAAHGPARSDRDRRHVLPHPARRHASRTGTASRCASRSRSRGSTSTAISRRTGARSSSSSGAGPYPDVGARSARAGRSSSSTTRTSPAASRSTPGAACCCARSSTSPTTRCTPRTCGTTRRPAPRAPS